MSGASIKRAERVAIACANNIAALSVLHKPNSLISKPFVNPQALHRRQWPGYSLPFDVETKLTSTLAFLASITHKSENVTATCIQEIPETSSVNVLVAVNKGSVMEGRKVLDRIRREFKDIFSTLAQVKADDPSEAEKKVLAAITSMCSGSISCFVDLARRLYVKDSRSVPFSFNGVLDYFPVDPFSKTNREQLKDFLQRLADLSVQSTRLIDYLNSGEEEQQLARFVHSACQLYHIGDARSFLAELPSEILDSDARESFIDQLSTVVKYGQAATFLFHAAREFPLVRRMRFIAAGLPEEAFGRIPADDHKPELEDAVPPGFQWDDTECKSIYQALNVSKPSADKEFAQHARRSLQDSKIHAEVQLVYYCELHASTAGLWPRVVRSSKDACWLCNAFIQFHGKMHTSKCHGKLHPTWRLPLLSGRLNRIANNFNNRLEKKLSESLKLAVRGKGQAEQPTTEENSLGSLLHNLTTSEICSDLEPSLSIDEKAKVEPTPGAVTLHSEHEAKDSAKVEVSI